jgi:hypothetical protein
MSYRLQGRVIARLSLVAIVSAAVTAAGCASVKGNGSSGDGGSNGGGNTGSGASSGGAGHGGSTGSGSGGNNSSGSGGGSGSDGGGCYQAMEVFNPQTPSVYVLVDRSGSEFQNATMGDYFTLRSATLQVIQMLQDKIRFGLGVFHGDHAMGACMPLLETVPIALNNYDAIAAKYNSLGMPAASPIDTPCFAVLPMVKDALMKDAMNSNGPKDVLFVTDGETDFCDNGEAVCPADAVTWAIQDMYAGNPSIGTLVIGLPASMNLNSISATVLQNFANAGAGLLPVVPQPNMNQTFTQTNIYNDCGNSVPAWKTAWQALNKPMNTAIATYGTPTMNATVYKPTAVSQQALADQIAAALKTVKNCMFDLTKVSPPVKVDLMQLDRASVTIQGQPVPRSDTDGWHMVSPTELELTGSWCTKWEDPMTDTIHFDFPCDIIIPS